MTTTRSRTLSADELDAFGARARRAAQRGDRQPRRARGRATSASVQAIVRYTEIGGRGLLFAGWLPPAWLAGTGLLAFSKIVDNMELGHNVMHGQYDWMNEPALRGDTYEWDNACDGDAWRHSHNYVHHTFTNVDGPRSRRRLRLPAPVPVAARGSRCTCRSRDRRRPGDALPVGRRAARPRARPRACAARGRRGRSSRARSRPVLRKALRQLAKDYVVFPAARRTRRSCRSSPATWPPTWSATCGRSASSSAATSPPTPRRSRRRVLADESRGAWYLRQLRGSSNLTGGPLFHFLTGNLSHQIEHHLFPDVPARALCRDGASACATICERYGQHYNTGSFWRQFTSVVARIVQLRVAVPSFGGGPSPPRRDPVKNTIARIEAVKDLIQEAVDKGATSVEQIHKTIADLPLAALEKRGLLGDEGRSARDAVDAQHRHRLRGDPRASIARSASWRRTSSRPSTTRSRCSATSARARAARNDRGGQPPLAMNAPSCSSPCVMPSGSNAGGGSMMRETPRSRSRFTPSASATARIVETSIVEGSRPSFLHSSRMMPRSQTSLSSSATPGK